ncbi:NUDIX hydrolase YfcD [Pantoea ananatis]|nr:NUDIX hydrolase YfcD [Pantoea ananatis]
MVDQTAGGEIEWVDIVSEENEVVAQATRAQMRAQCLRHRATYIVVHDGMGKILVQRRTEIKDFMPGKLDATAGGVVQSGEDMLESARREAEEELGIADVPFAEHGKFYFEDEHCRVWGDYSAVCRTALLLCRKKKWMKFSGMTPDEITARCDEFTDDSLKALSLWLSRNNENSH